MNCDCVEKVLAKAKKHILERPPYKKKIKEITLGGQLISIDGGNWVTRTYSDILIELEGQKKKETMSLAHSFCPFCGKSQGRE